MSVEARMSPALRSVPFFPVTAAADLMGSSPAVTPVPSLILRDGAAHTALRDLAQDALAAAAAARGEAPARFAEATDIVGRDRWPSRNDAGSRSAIRSAVLAKDGAGDPVALDLHLARTGVSGWEVAAFDAGRRGARDLFPYSDDPLGVAESQFDARSGQFCLSDRRRMLQVVPQPVVERGSAGPGRSRAALVVAVLFAAFFAALFAVLGAVATLAGRSLA